MNHEARALSALLKNGDMISVMSDNIGTMMISHKDIWEFIWLYYQTNRATPPVSIVIEEYPDFDYQESIEGATKHYVESLREHTAKAELERVIVGAVKSMSEGKARATDLLDHFNKRIAAIQRQTGTSRAIDVRDIDNATEHYDKVKELSKLHNGQPGISTGFQFMDEVYATGMAPGHFIVLMGFSGSCKSWFGIKLMINAWLQGYSPMIINLEMTPEELRDRIYFLISTYNMSDLVKADIELDQFAAWAEDFMKGKAEFHLVGNEGFGNFTTAMVRAKIEQYKPDIVLLDYLQLFSDQAQSNSEIERAKRTAREVNMIAKSARIPIIGITAVTGKDKKDRINPPEIAQVAWSSEIEYAANLAFAVHTNREAITNKAKPTDIVCRKNRHGELFQFTVKMDFENGIITEIEPEDQLHYLADNEDNLEFLDE